MGIDNILSLVAGLALFLLGMNSMGSGLENACGNKMKGILEKLTSNRFLVVLVGALITMVIQSSSANTVMVVGFVNAGMMTLSQTVLIIMGANIGTTITGQLIALDIGFIAPIFAIIGVIMIVFIKKPTLNEIVKEEIKEYRDVINQMLEISMDSSKLREVEQLEDKTDKMTIEYKTNMIKRLSTSICTAEGSIIYSNVLINFERLGDHLLNIAENSSKVK